MKINWHVRAARVQASHPHWTWSQVCAEVARGRRSPLTKPTVAQFTRKMEQMKLF